MNRTEAPLGPQTLRTEVNVGVPLNAQYVVLCNMSKTGGCETYKLSRDKTAGIHFKV
jgi:hypothetical protein